MNEPRIIVSAGILTLLSLSFNSCKNQSRVERFQLLLPRQTGIDFRNTIQDNDSINILTYEYLYNGGGVGVLDVNNDGLPDLFFTGNQVSNALYLNKGNFQFEDISAVAGIRLPDQWCTGVSIIDINSDGYDDIYVCVGGRGNKSEYPNKLFINQWDLTFKEEAAEYGLDDPGESIQAAFFDYDNDGDLDMYLLTGGGFERSAIMVRPVLDKGQNRNTDRLYKNHYDEKLGHPVFENVSAQAGILIEGFGLGVSILDANQDNWPDVYVSNDYLSRDILYINNHNSTFTDRSLDYFGHTSHFSMGNGVGDINNDGLPDIVTLDMMPQKHARKKLMFDPNDFDQFYLSVQQNYGYQYMRNMLQLDRGNGSFSEIGQLAGIDKTDWSWAPLIADFDNDGFEDLYITNGYGKDITDLDFVKFRNEAFPPFTDRAERMNIFRDSLRSRPSISLPNYFYRNEKDLTFSDQSEAWGIVQPSISTGAAYADLDNDGDLDLIVNNINQDAFIYRNNLVELDSANTHFLDVKLNGLPTNLEGFGATVSLYKANERQTRYCQVVKGFQSTVDRTLHFGLGAATTADSLIVLWPDGKETRLKNIKAGKTITIRYADDVTTSSNAPHKGNVFERVSMVKYEHKEVRFNDFKIQPLLQHGFSNQGPGVAVGDINGDGLDDFVVGGSYGFSASYFLQNKNGTFDQRVLDDAAYEDLGMILLDVDGDHDLDLYVASGGSERYADHKDYQDRLYLNDGHGYFSMDSLSLPMMHSSTSVVVAGDFDQDGDNDLFVGGRVIPGQYPKAPQSFVLENVNGRFIDVTEKWSPSLSRMGMVTSATWTDFNNDGRLDLVVAGEFMPITLLKNAGNEFVDVTDGSGLENSYGMWNSVLAADLDNDGDMDLVAGNVGRNTPYELSAAQPLSLFYTDFDHNGSVDPVFSSYEEGKAYPLADLDQLTTQLPMVKKYLLHYRDYARVTTKELLGILGAPSCAKLSCSVQTTSIIENLGNGHFSITALPVGTQFAPVNGIASEDINLDGEPDLILVGNSYSPDVVEGRYDASIGVVLLNKGLDNFEEINSDYSGFIARGDARGIVRLELADKESVLVVAQNNGPLMAYHLSTYDGLQRERTAAGEVGALVTLKDGRVRKVEFTKGGGYLSQSSNSLVVTPLMKKIEFLDSKGSTTRTIDVNNDHMTSR